MAKHKKTDDGLASLRGEATATPPTGTPHSAGPVFIIYKGRTGNSDGTFAHTGAHVVCPPGGSPIRFEQGLNIHDGAQWAKAQAHAPIAAMLTDANPDHGPQLKVVDAELSGLTRLGIKALSKITDQAQALAHLLELEQRRPETAGKKHRKDHDLIALLQRRLAGARARHQVDLSDVMRQAKVQTQAAKAS